MRGALDLALIRRAFTRGIVGVDTHTSAPTSSLYLWPRGSLFIASIRVDVADNSGSWNQHEIRSRQFMRRKGGAAETQGARRIRAPIDDVASFGPPHIEASGRHYN